MSKAHNTIIEFMRLKASFLPKPFNAEYFLPADEAAIRIWDAATVASVLRLIQKNYTHLDYADDTMICPFCVSHRLVCNYCEYGNVHGQCNIHSPASTYRSLCKMLPGDGSITGYLTRQQHKELANVLGVEIQPSIEELED